MLPSAQLPPAAAPSLLHKIPNHNQSPDRARTRAVGFTGNPHVWLFVKAAASLQPVCVCVADATDADAWCAAAQ